MERIASERGSEFDSMAELRDLALEDLQSLQWTQDQFMSYPAILVLLYARAIGLFDLVRIALEHGYGVRSRNLIRSLVDIEIDVALLSTEDEELRFRYGAYEALELARKAEHGLKWVVDATDEVEGVEHRRGSLKQMLEAGGVSTPDDFDDLNLGDAADFFAKKIFGRRYPPHWRLPLKREEWLTVAADQLAGAAPTEAGDFGSSRDGIKWEIEYAYMWCSEAVHVSPRSVAESTVWDEDQGLRGYVVGGHIQEIPASVFMATLHFVRLRLLVDSIIGFPASDDGWLATYKGVTTQE